MKTKINRLLLLSTVLLCFVGGTLAYQSPSPTPPKEKQVEYIEDGEDTNQDSHPSSSEKSSATSGSDNENALTQIQLYKNQLSQTLTKHVNWISSLLEPTQNKYIPQLHTAYTRWNGELQALIDGNYIAGTLSSNINTAKTFFIDGTAELEKIYDSACKADDDLSTENNKAYKDVVSYQEQLSSVAKKDSLCINRMQEPIKVVYIPQLSAVHAEYNSKINNVIDSYYHSATLSNHIEEAKHFFLDGSDELTSVYNDASKANEKVSDNDIVYYRVLSYKAKLSTKTSDYITTLTPRIEDYLQQIFFPYISERRDVWMNNLQKLIDDNYQSGTLAKMASKAEEFFLKGSDEITQIYNDACNSNVEDYTGSISVSFPDNADMKPFGKMTIEMENLNTHQIVQYSISNKKTYTFTNIPRNTNWTVRVKNKYGDIFASINDVCVNKKNITASFSTLSKPQDVTLQLYDDNGKEISQSFSVTWYDDKGNLLQTGKTISDLTANKQVFYELKLDTDLTRKYKKTDKCQYIVKENDNTIKHALTPYASVKICGKVINAETKIPSNADITLTQTFDNGVYSTKSVSTDMDGNFSIVASDVSSILSVKSSGLIAKDIPCDMAPTSEGEKAIGTIALSPIKGKELVLDVNYQKSTEDEASPETTNWYDDANNLSFSVYNLTKGKQISEVVIEYPRIIFLEEIEDGDILEVTVSNKKNTFTPVKNSIVMSNENPLRIAVSIVELGKIQANYSLTENSEVVGVLYDHNGNYVKSSDYENKRATFSSLQDGNYYLLSMGKSNYFNSLNTIKKIAQTGLIQGKDYILDNINVSSGKVSVISNEAIPVLNEAVLYYTDDRTSFGLNKTKVTAGNYVTIQSTVYFKDGFKDKVKNVELIVDMPDGASFIENSVMEGLRTSSYSVDDNSLTVPLQSLSERVRACFVATKNGTSKLSAYVRFQYDDQTILQPIGDAILETSGFAINVPSITNKDNINVSGTTTGKSTINVYDNDILIGQTTSLENGTWSLGCQLHESYNLSVHRIYAQTETKHGEKIYSESKECRFDVYAIQVSKVTMYHWNPEMRKTYESVFDFLNPSAKANQWVVYYPKKKFTYTIEFTENSPEKICNVVLYVHAANGQIVPVYPEYNKDKGLWIAELDMGGSRDGFYPVNVSVDFDMLSYGPVSRKALTEAKFDYDNYTQEVGTISREVDNLITSIPNLSIEDFENAFKDSFGSFVNVPNSNTNDLTLNGLLENADLLLTQSEKILSDNNVNNGWKQLLHKTEFGTFDLNPLGIDGSLRIEEVGKNTAGQLIELGFKKIEVDDNTDVYELVTNDKYILVDFSSNTYITLTYNHKGDLISRRQVASSNPNDIQILIDQNVLFEGKVSELIDLCSGINEAIAKVPEFLKNCIWVRDAQISTNRNTYQALRKSITPDMSEEDIAKITEKVEKLIQKNCKLGQDKRLLKATLKNLEPAISKITLGVSAICNAYSTGNNIKEYINLWYDVPYCGCDSERTTALQKSILKAGLRCAAKDIANIVADMILLHTVIVSAASAPETGGQSLIVTAGSIALSCAKNNVNVWSNNEFAKERAMFLSEANAIGRDKNCENCPNPDPKPKPNNPPSPKPKPGNGGNHNSGNPNDNVQIDPSGFVYEGVPSNRLEGVTATCYYKEFTEDMYGDTHENIVLWDAKEYGQENPLKTDENGYYRWDVPQGLWQVKFEKEGYETVYSEWLPVPPPQLDVNIAMTQARQPEINRVHAYKNAVEITFDKFMQTESLVKDNIIIYDGDQAVKGNIVLLDEETNPTIANKTFASKLRYTCQKSFKNKEIKLLIKKNVKSYSSINMENDYECTIPVENEITEIKIDSVLSLAQGATMEVAVNVLPAKSSSGKKILISNYSSKIVGIQKDTIFVDDNGLASFNIRGEMLGNTALILTIDGYDLSTKVDVNVINESSVTDIVKASIESGATVEEGTKIYLSCNTPEAKIYYTIDGSCPCGSTALVYNGEPIIVNENMTIKAMAIAPGMYESEIVEYQYFVQTTEIESTVINDGVSVTPLTVKDKITIMSNDSSVISDVKVIDMSGKVVMESSKTGATVSLDMSRCSSGIHLLNFKTNGRNMSKKVVKID